MNARKMFLFFISSVLCLVAGRAGNNTDFTLTRGAAISVECREDAKIVHTAMSILKNDMQNVFSS